MQAYTPGPISAGLKLVPVAAATATAATAAAAALLTMTVYTHNKSGNRAALPAACCHAFAGCVMFSAMCVWMCVVAPLARLPNTKSLAT